MSIRGGSFLHSAGGFVMDRIQRGGAGNLGLVEEKIRELGNDKAVATVRDVPDLTFDVESFDVTTEIEALITNNDPSATDDGDEFDFALSKPLDVISPFTGGVGLSRIVRGLAVPYLSLESATYRFGVRQNSTQAFAFRGDSIYYIPGSPYYQAFPAAGVGPYVFDHRAILHDESGSNAYALCVTLFRADGTYQRLFLGADYTNTSSGFTLVAAAPVGSVLHVVYGSSTAADYPDSVHQGVAVKPAAVRGKDIDVYVGVNTATPTLVLWKGLQSAEVAWRANLQADEELGNAHVVSRDYDNPEVTGTLTMRAPSIEYLFDRIAQVTDTLPNEIAGVFSSQPLELHIVINHPDTGAPLKTLVVDDARFQPPALQGQVNQRLDVPFPFTSDTGGLKVVTGAA